LLSVLSVTLVFATGGRAVSEPYYSQRARSVCVSLSAFFHISIIITGMDGAIFVSMSG